MQLISNHFCSLKLGFRQRPSGQKKIRKSTNRTLYEHPGAHIISLQKSLKHCGTTLKLQTFVKKGGVTVIPRRHSESSNSQSPLHIAISPSMNLSITPSWLPIWFLDQSTSSGLWWFWQEELISKKLLYWNTVYKSSKFYPFQPKEGTFRNKDIIGGSLQIVKSHCRPNCHFAAWLRTTFAAHLHLNKANKTKSHLPTTVPFTKQKSPKHTEGASRSNRLIRGGPMETVIATGERPMPGRT